MGYLMLARQDVFSKSLCDKIRKRLKLTEKELSDKDIRKLTSMSNEMISEWVINNADGFKLKNNGILIISKYMPKCFRRELEEATEVILANPNTPKHVKDMFIKRYEKAMTLRKNLGTNEAYTNTHSFFHMYRAMWFNKDNCDFDKAKVYEFELARKFKSKLAEYIIKGRDYFEWQFSDFQGGRFAPANRRKVRTGDKINPHYYGEKQKIKK